METIVSLRVLRLTVGLFKSYYVVWKHAVKFLRSRPETKFKSYYVVWKPEISADIGELVGSLNRTM